MKTVFKDYGPALGPMVAVLTFLSRSRFDRWISARTIAGRIEKLKQTILWATPPVNEFHGVTPEKLKPLPHVDEMSTLYNVWLFRGRLDVVRFMLAEVERTLSTSSDTEQLAEFFGLKQSFNRLFTRIDGSEECPDSRDELTELRAAWEQVSDNLENGKKPRVYVTHANRSKAKDGPNELESGL
jgi:hypothetical protein